MSPDEILTLHNLARRLRQAGHGSKAALKQTTATALNISVQTLHLKLKEVGYECGRKARSDKGTTAIDKGELELVSAALMATTRRNGKRTLNMQDAAEMLRANGMIKAERVCKSTGEIVPISAPTIARALRLNALHPSQLNAPSPHVQVRYKGPNHVWQVDASVCVVFYLPEGGAALMDEKKYYKNKPEHFEKIKKQRVIRYVMTDCYSGCVLVRYYLGAETQANLLDFIIWCMTPRIHNGQEMPMHGMPEGLQDDAGSANGAHMVTNLFSVLEIKHHTHAVGNAKASGSVENAQNLVETKFEHKLSFVKTDDLAELNERAAVWMHSFNARRTHSRHGKTRYGMWQTIGEAALRRAPPAHILYSLPVSKIETRSVDGELTISFALGKLKSATYDVRHVPGIMVNAKVEVQVNPFESAGVGAEAVPLIRVRMAATDYAETADWVLCKPIFKTEGGYREDAPMWGEEYKSHGDTVADTNRKRVNEIAYGTADARLANMAKFDKRKPAFDGKVNPFAVEQQTMMPIYLPRTGTDSALEAVQRQEQPISLVVLAGALRKMLDTDYSKDTYAWLKAQFPDDLAPASTLDRLGEFADAWRGVLNPSEQQATGTNDVRSSHIRRIK